MKGKVLGIIFPNKHDEAIPELTRIRTMASVPFGGRYRMIDFTLSGFVAAGIEKVGVVPRTSYVSLMDHIGSGKEWDLARKRGGINIFPPYGEAGTKSSMGKLDALENILGYIETSGCDDVVMADCDIVCAVDYKDLIAKHRESGADVTVVYRKEVMDISSKTDNMTLKLDGDKVGEILINDGDEHSVNSGMWIYAVKKDFLVKAVEKARSGGYRNFEQDVLQRYIGKINVKGYEYSGYAKRITNLKSYFEANLDLLNKESLYSLFSRYPIFTKIRDDAPVRYAIGCSAKNIIAGDGCFIEGEVSSSVLFRGVKIGRDAVVRNCVLMQDTVIEDGAWIENVICDKSVVITSGQKLIGSANHPVYVEKKAKV